MLVIAAHRCGGLLDVVGTRIDARAAILYDWENRWIIDQISGPRNEKKDYLPTCISHYLPFWKNGVAVDMVNEDGDFSCYALLIAPMLYMIRPGVGERIEKFVADGGVFVATYLSGIADESNLCFLGGWPGPLRKVLGIWSEEIDALYDDERVTVVAAKENDTGLCGTYEARELCDLIHAESAGVLATYGSEFYAGRPAVTVNRFGKGRAYYIASRNDERFNDDFYGNLISALGLGRAIDAPLPIGVTARVRTDGVHEYVFIMNFTRNRRTVDLGKREYTDMMTGKNTGETLTLDGYRSAVLKRAR